MANHKDKEIFFNGKPFLVKRGSFVMSLNTAKINTGLSVQNIRTAIKVLTNFKIVE